jgi:hypothetical protein
MICAHDESMNFLRTPNVCCVLLLALAAIACGLSSCSPTQHLSSAPVDQTVRPGEIFAELYSNQDRLMQIEKDARQREWRIDCISYSGAKSFLRIQLPANATFDDIKYFVDLTGISEVQMLYATMHKEACPLKGHMKAFRKPYATAPAGPLPVAIDATGMDPQIRLMREQAATQSWPITCMGHAGEEGVIRIGIPPGTSNETVERFEAVIRPVASSTQPIYPDNPEKGCDHKPIIMESAGSPESVLTFSAGGEDAQLLGVARDCGYARAHWRSA